MIQLTNNADIHLSSIVAENEVAGVKLAVNSGGCSGFTYDWQLVTEEEMIDIVDDYIIDLDTGKLFIDNLSIMYIAGMVVDYKKDIFGQRLMIDNPNVESMCGCGESFQFNPEG
tara:strand:+ start:195 stop:536 length:342 start_codon:yes stop_codon:yes gene_type:complete